jgi:hypothetical protein
MSAFIIDDAAIDVILDTLKAAVSVRPFFSRLYWRDAEKQPRFFDRHDAESNDKLSELGRMLLAQNARSVAYRYSEGQNPCALTYCYKPTRKDVHLFHLRDAYDSTRPGAFITASAALKNIACYEYQSCETDDWEETEAYRFCEALKDRIADTALRNDADPWGWTDAHLGRAS